MSAQNKTPSSKSSEATRKKPPSTSKPSDSAEMKTPSSTKSFESTSTGKSTNESDLLTKVTPRKRALDFSLPVKLLQYSPHGRKQVPMYGYLIKVGNITTSQQVKVYFACLGNDWRCQPQIDRER